MKAIKTIYTNGTFQHRIESDHLSIFISEVEYRTILSEAGKENEVVTKRTKSIELDKCTMVLQAYWANRIVKYYAANRKDISDLEKHKMILKRNLSMLNKDLKALKKLKDIK